MSLLTRDSGKMVLRLLALVSSGRPWGVGGGGGGSVTGAQDSR